AAEHEQNPAHQREAYELVAHGPDERRGEYTDQGESDVIRIDAKDEHQPVKLAVLLPVVFGREPHGWAFVKKREHRQKRNSRGTKFEDFRARTKAARTPQAFRLEREEAEAIERDAHQMAKEQRDHEGSGGRIAPRPGTVAQRDPGGERPQDEANPEEIIRDADQKNVVVNERRSDQR